MLRLIFSLFFVAGDLISLFVVVWLVVVFNRVSSWTEIRWHCRDPVTGVLASHDCPAGIAR
jgi:hypothetical protein